jgi:GTP-binding protein YchF
MKIAITGLSNSGKTTIFNALTGLSAETTVYPTTAGEPRYGVVDVPDERVDRLSELYKPKKTTYSKIEYIDYLGLTKGDQKQNRSVLELLKDADAVVQVVRAFEDEAVVHPLGGVDPLRDAGALRTELILGDLELVERRLDSMEQMGKKGKKPDEAERTALLRCKESLEEERPLRGVGFSGDELLALRHLQFMTLKPEIIVLNIAEGDLGSERTEETRKKLEESYGGPVVALSGKVEMEIAELLAEERKAFLDELGIEEPALDRLIRVSYGCVGLISFLTVGEDEVRAWALRKGTDALHAAGKIHSDIQRGFIRAEVVSYEDFIAAGNMAAAREKGHLRLEGKGYVVQDGDIINFRFNV